MYNGIILKKDMFIDIEGPIKVAIYADGINDKEQLDAVNSFLSKYRDKELINDMIDIKKLEIHKTNALHECIQGYIKQPKRTPNRKTDEDFLIICQLLEKLQIAECDEVWIFNNGDNFIDFGRLDKLLNALHVPVKFLQYCYTDKIWDFYKGREYIEDSGRLVFHEYLIAEDVSFNFANENENRIRAFSKDVLSEKEYNISMRALSLTGEADYIREKGILRNDQELINKANKLMETCNHIFFGILTTEIQESEFADCDAALDFTEAELHQLVRLSQKTSTRN